MGESEYSIVMNLFDNREETYVLPPDEAVVAAYEQFEKGNFEVGKYPRPNEHPHFKEYRRGFACGDWIARKNRGEFLAANKGSHCPISNETGLTKASIRRRIEGKLAHVRCPRCACDALYRYGRVRSGKQRFLCLMCGRQFTLWDRRETIQQRPFCPCCSKPMHFYKREDSAVRFRCSNYPSCKSFVKVRLP